MFKVEQIRSARNKKNKLTASHFFLLHFTFKLHQLVSALLLQQV